LQNDPSWYIVIFGCFALLPALLEKITNIVFFLQFQALICLVDKKTGEKSKTRPRFVKQDQVAIMRIECAGVICLEPFKEFPQMGRFTLRDESKFLRLLNYFDFSRELSLLICLIHQSHQSSSV